MSDRSGPQDAPGAVAVVSRGFLLLASVALVAMMSIVVCDVIVQDEFTHDVVLPWQRGLHLVYDTT